MLPVENQNLENAPFVIEMEQKLEQTVALEPIDPGFTGPEILAIREFKKLEAMNSYDLAGVILRYKIMKKIESMNLHTVLPGNYSLEEAYEVVGRMNRTQQSVVKGLNEVVFPYTRSIGIPTEQLWNEVGKSNLADVLPHLKVVITGTPSKSAGVNKAVERLYTQIDTLGSYSPSERRRMAVERLIAHGSATNAELRANLDEDQDRAQVAFLHRNGTTFLIAELNPDQAEKMHNRLAQKADIVHVSLEKEKPLTIPVIKKLLEG
ncbi:MAG TPA: hypothetical protein PKD55_01535 [Bellilinea sp.]|nr:hypothetical protein [Bellilinea sp.]